MQAVRVTPDVAVTLQSVSKSFGATQALAEVDFEVEQGTVHALIGENGAGKSTALGTIAGRVAIDHGSVEVCGRLLGDGDLRAARATGVSAIYQELTIIPHLDAVANVFLGAPLAHAGVLSKREMRRRYEGLCEELQVDAIPAGVRAGDLSVAQQQMLEIMRSLVIDPKVILFDEPSASLAAEEREALYRAIAKLKSRGVTIIFVSHNFDEVEELADRITVFRNGRSIMTVRRGEASRGDLVRAMLGEQRGENTLGRVLVDAATGREAEGEASARAAVLEVRDLTVPGVLDAIDLDVRPGEVLGIAGLVGSGRSTLLRALAGAEPAARGSLRLGGEEVPVPRSIRAARRLGIGLLPEDRKGQGLVPSMAAANNVALVNLSAVSRGGVVARSALVSRTSDALSRLNFPIGRLRERAERFSGGNQQKLLMARWIYDRPRVLLADEPTRGIDVGAKGELLEMLRKMAAENVAVIMVSSELEEVLSVSDRVLVISKGRNMGVMDRARGEIAMEDVLHAAFGLEESK